MGPTEDERLRHMLDAAREAVELLGDSTIDDVQRNRMLALSLVKLIEIVGEAAAHVSPARRQQFRIEWPEIVATRNRLIHSYHDIDAAIVVQTVRLDFPPVIKALEYGG